MNCQEAVSYIHSAAWHGQKPGLSRMKTMLAALGNPQDSFRCIHVAGTNGKGSVCAMLDSVLRAQGYRTGLFTSPYIREFRERMRVDGVPIDGEVLADITETVRPYAEALTEKPTVFELVTVIAFEYFRRSRVDVVVLEVGLGGRLDPTNVIQNPWLSVITGIDFDHTQQLGNTLQSIATEKAGIIKEGRPCLYGGTDSSACRTIGAVAQAKKAPFHTVDRSLLSVRRQTLDGTVLDFDGERELFLPLLGAYQPENVAIVLTALQVLSASGLPVREEAIRQGLRNVSWPARFELMNRSPLVICDGGHNPQGVKAAVKSMALYFPDERVNVLSAVMEDKDYDEMIEELKSVANKIYTVSVPNNPRALPAEQYAMYCAAHKVPAEAFGTVEDGVRAAMEDSANSNRPLLCLGSLYLYSAVCDLVRGNGG